MPKYKQLIKEYKNEYGLKKYRKLKNHITNSSKCSNFFTDSLQGNSIPFGRDFVIVIMDHWRYSIASIDTIFFASLILLDEWMEIIGEPKKEITDREIVLIEKQIFRNCREMGLK